MSTTTSTRDQYIETAGGERLAVIPEAVYLRMLEALEDRADAEAARLVLDQLASSETEMIPSEFVNRLIDGENTVKVWREFRGLTIDSLAERAGISESELSEIENDLSDGRLGTIKKIADALDISVDDLV
jgi:DNA-binding XRE family transcriptional regulator